MKEDLCARQNRQFQVCCQSVINRSFMFNIGGLLEVRTTPIILYISFQVHQIFLWGFKLIMLNASKMGPMDIRLQQKGTKYS